MKHIGTLRGFAVLARTALGACDTTRSPTAIEAPAAPLFNTYPGPTGLTVTN